MGAFANPRKMRLTLLVVVCLAVGAYTHTTETSFIQDSDAVVPEDSSAAAHTALGGTENDAAVTAAAEAAVAGTNDQTGAAQVCKEGERLCGDNQCRNSCEGIDPYTQTTGY